MRATSIAGSILLATACTSSDAVYTPGGASAWNDGYPAAVTAFPPGAPAGTVELASFGLIELIPAEVPPMVALHARIAVTNNASERPWNVDVAGATLRVNGSEARTLLANGDLPTLPIALIGRGEARTIDLYFAPPSGIRDEDDLAELDLHVLVSAPDKPAAARAHFTRREPSELTGARKAAVRLAGSGSHWWADPSYPWPTFHRSSGAISPKAPEHAVVIRLPRWQRAPLPRSAQR